MYILPVELTIRKASAIVACADDELSVTPKQMSSSLGGKTGALLSIMKGRRGSQEGVDILRDLETKGASSYRICYTNTIRQSFDFFEV